MLEAEYIAAFQRCYPHKSIILIPRKVGPGEWRTRVVIDREAGDLMLTDDDLRDATKMFNRGRA